MKDSVRANLKRYYLDIVSKDNHSFMRETDTSITVYYRAASYIKPFDFVAHFDTSNVCDKETCVFTCEKCLKKNVRKEVKRYKWIKVDDSNYVSSYKRKICLKVNKPEGGQYSYSYQRFSYTKDKYDFSPLLVFPHSPLLFLLTDNNQ